MLTIVGRHKDLIIRSGFNVFPIEVEGVIAAHPDVALAAVVGRPCEGNEEVVAFIQPRAQGALDVRELDAFVAERLVSYKRPAEYIVRNALPTTAAGCTCRKPRGSPNSRFATPFSARRAFRPARST